MERLLVASEQRLRAGAALRRWAHRWLVVLVMLAAAGGSGWLFSTAKSELAPLEDRGVIAMPVRAPDGATLDYTARYLDAIEAIAAQYPEFDRRFIFIGGGQVSSAFGVMRTVDWGERERTHAANWRAPAAPAVGAARASAPSRSRRPAWARASARGRSTYVLVSQRQLREHGARRRSSMLAEMAQEPRHRAARHRPAAEQARDLHGRRPRPRRRHRRLGGRGGAHGRDHARRPRRHPLQARRRAVRRDGADRCTRPHAARGHRTPVRARPRRHDGAAVVAGHGARGGQPARAEPLQPAPLGHDHRQPGAGLRARRGAGLHGRDWPHGAAARLCHRAQRRQPRVPRRFGCAGPGVRAGAALHLPGAVGAVRELHRPVRDPARGAAVDGRRARCDAPVRRHAERLFADRPDHAGRADHQARHPDRRVQQPAAPAGAAGDRRRGARPPACACARS